MTVKHTLVYHEPPRILRALVPRLRGDGYLKRPVGHHHEPWIAVLEDAVRGDVSGLDGHVEVETFGDTTDVLPDFRDALEQVWGFPVRMVDRNEFFERHPVGSDPDRAPAP